MQQSTAWFWFWIGIFCTCSAVCLGMLLLWFYRWICKPKRRATRSALDWETSPLPEREDMDFGAFYILLLRYGRYTRVQAERFYELSMYQMAEGEPEQLTEEVLDAYDAEIEAELIIEEIMEQGA